MIAEVAARFFPELDALMRQIIASIPDAPDFGVMLRYAIGWVDEHDQPYHQPTGKRIRPLLLMLSAEAIGGDWRQALPAAAAVELLHNFSLIHDDIQDDSPLRHGRPTVWKIWSVANAINAGDAMFALAYSAMHKLSTTTLAPTTVLNIWDIFNRTNIELTRGQHLDMRFEKQADVTIDQYLSMIGGKSAALVACCAQIGALCGGAAAAVAEAFAAFGLNLGLAFQIRDDILGIWGNPSTTGKSAATDIISRKKTLPILYGLERSARLAELFRCNSFTDEDIAEAVAILDNLGAQQYAVEMETQYYQRALDALAQSGTPESRLEGLRALSAWLFKRTY